MTELKERPVKLSEITRVDRKVWANRWYMPPDGEAIINCFPDNISKAELWLPGNEYLGLGRFPTKELAEEAALRSIADNIKEHGEQPCIYMGATIVEEGE